MPFDEKRQSENDCLSDSEFHFHVSLNRLRDASE